MYLLSNWADVPKLFNDDFLPVDFSNCCTPSSYKEIGGAFSNPDVTFYCFLIDTISYKLRNQIQKLFLALSNLDNVWCNILKTERW